MSNEQIGSNSRTREIIKKYGVRAKKGFGQNFLTNPDVLNGIVSAADIQKGDNVIEIGPGLGALTEKLAQAAGEVVALEIDEDLLPILADVLAKYNNVKVINQDVLKADLPTLIDHKFTDPHRPVKVIANLPYYITSPILMRLLECPVEWATICVMMQKEVADRLTAEVGTKQYGALTLAIEYRMDAQLAFGVSRHSFVPAPNVDSAIVTLTPRDKKLAVHPFDEQKLFSLIKVCFTHRRKNLWNNLKALMGKDKDQQVVVKDVLSQLNINPQLRAETLTLEKFIKLANLLHQNQII